ncbi:hypothetical protein GCM10008927_23290 [Amylibacter ulvae]|uniref:HPr kinase/phosphorylase C-terminal domain-containing protein n=1 Tax=Paramylibacter ulvae TaxID=1651968 RepID=A0ABQ3D3I1_9RHOB|nr:HPr kinase/phosphatase C-terminal domain-containing protein [Amylibacter ulvae]GHA56813.1 hypothetical protein GCM10008927_23290 [Amylibacter ulvae]
MSNEIATGLVHATCVTLNGFGVLIVGTSGSGKSQLGLALMGLGAELVGDDQLEIIAGNRCPIAMPAPNIQGIIEARNVGILNAKFAPQSAINLVVDLSQREPDRLPRQHKAVIAGHTLEIVFGRDIPNLHFAVYQWMQAGRRH